jgi:hypothetical protein
MNKVPIIRKNSYKEYLNTSILGGFMAGLLFGGLALLSSGSILVFIGVGIGLWGFIIIIYMTVGFPREEYFKRKKRIVELQSRKYNFLYENNFELHEDLFFEGIFKGYYFRIYPIVKWIQKGNDIKYETIEAYYDYDKNRFNHEKENNLCGEYFLGQLEFGNQIVGYLPKDWECPNFKENLEGLLYILKREGLYPIEKSVWDKEIGDKLKREKEEEEESRTVHLLRIGKFLDIKCIMAEKSTAKK